MGRETEVQSTIITGGTLSLEYPGIHTYENVSPNFLCVENVSVPLTKTTQNDDDDDDDDDDEDDDEDDGGYVKSSQTNSN